MSDSQDDNTYDLKGKNIISLAEARNRSERPDPEFIKRDDFGKEMYLFTLGYEFQGGAWSTELWAYSHEDAEARVAAMRISLECHGQLYTVVPA
jgi:hypothetical protein